MFVCLRVIIESEHKIKSSNVHVDDNYSDIRCDMHCGEYIYLIKYSLNCVKPITCNFIRYGIIDVVRVHAHDICT